jgi:hypothetical protein
MYCRSAFAELGFEGEYTMTETKILLVDDEEVFVAALVKRHQELPSSLPAMAPASYRGKSLAPWPYGRGWVVVDGCWLVSLVLGCPPGFFDKIPLFSTPMMGLLPYGPLVTFSTKLFRLR